MDSAVGMHPPGVCMPINVAWHLHVVNTIIMTDCIALPSPVEPAYVLTGRRWSSLLARSASSLTQCAHSHTAQMPPSTGSTQRWSSRCGWGGWQQLVQQQQWHEQMLQQQLYSEQQKQKQGQQQQQQQQQRRMVSLAQQLQHVLLISAQHRELCWSAEQCTSRAAAVWHHRQQAAVTAGTTLLTVVHAGADWQWQSGPFPQHHWHHSQSSLGAWMVFG
jgi:hypothetical protein